MRSIAALSSACISGVLLISGCATIINGSKQEIRFDSDPAGAAVYIDANQECQTPCTLELSTKTTHELKLAKDGYAPEQSTIITTTNPMFFVNLLFGTLGLVGMGVDYLTGAMFKLEDRGFSYELEPPKKDEKTEAADAGQTATADPVSPLVPESAKLRAIKEQYPESYMLSQILDYYGEKPDDQSKDIMERLYQVLLRQEESDRELDLEEAMRIEQFENHSGH